MNLYCIGEIIFINNLIFFFFIVCYLLILHTNRKYLRLRCENKNYFTTDEDLHSGTDLGNTCNLILHKKMKFHFLYSTVKWSI